MVCFSLPCPLNDVFSCNLHHSSGFRFAALLRICEKLLTITRSILWCTSYFGIQEVLEKQKSFHWIPPQSCLCTEGASCCTCHSRSDIAFPFSLPWHLQKFYINLQRSVQLINELCKPFHRFTSNWWNYKNNLFVNSWVLLCSLCEIGHLCCTYKLQTCLGIWMLKP